MSYLPASNLETVCEELPMWHLYHWYGICTPVFSIGWDVSLNTCNICDIFSKFISLCQCRNVAILSWISSMLIPNYSHYEKRSFPWKKLSKVDLPENENEKQL